jgi:hypothetical protein
MNTVLNIGKFLPGIECMKVDCKNLQLSVAAAKCKGKKSNKFRFQPFT